MVIEMSVTTDSVVIICMFCSRIACVAREYIKNY